ncbi:MAG: RNA polymerase subunit sigma [Flavobacteriaceae bacterium]|nr:RNA polymerase subunit sigma [Flavobacteriaceae bacterium]
MPRNCNILIIHASYIKQLQLDSLRIQNLIKKCQDDESKAQFEIYKMYSKQLYNTAYRIVKHEGEAEDVVQEAFIKAFRNINNFSQKVPLMAWLKRIVVNQSIEHQKKLKYYDFDAQYKLEQEQASFENENEEQEIDSGTLSSTILKKAIRKLPERESLILNLHLIEGYDYDEIQEITGLSYANCRTSFSRAKKRLHNELKAKNIS